MPFSHLQVSVVPIFENYLVSRKPFEAKHWIPSSKLPLECILGCAEGLWLEVQRCSAKMRAENDTKYHLIIMLLILWNGKEKEHVEEKGHVNICALMTGMQKRRTLWKPWPLDDRISNTCNQAQKGYFGIKLEQRGPGHWTIPPNLIQIGSIAGENEHAGSIWWEEWIDMTRP